MQCLKPHPESISDLPTTVTLPTPALPDAAGTSFFSAGLYPPRLGFATLTGLKPDAEYHYRVVAVNEAGTSYGEDASFDAK